MAVTREPQSHIETLGSLINDGLNPLDHDANAVDLEDTIAHIASQIKAITGESGWELAPDATIAALAAQPTLTSKLAIREVQLLTDITVPASQNYKILSVAGSELPSIVKSTSLSTKGLVSALHGGTFGTHALDEVAGDNAINPQNLIAVVDGSTGDNIMSDSRIVWALLQHESGATDGALFTDTTPERAQISFVRVNATHDDLEACPVADIENKVINLKFNHLTDLNSWTAQDFLRRTAFVDLAVGAAAGITLDNVIDNQGVTPATLQTNLNIRIDDDSAFNLQTSDGAINLFSVMPAAAGDEIEMNLATLDVNATTVDFSQGISVDTADQSLNLGSIAAGQIDSTALKLKASTGNLDLESTAGELTFKSVRETTALPLDDATAGKISTLFGQSFASLSAAIKYAGEHGGLDLAFKRSVLAADYAAGVNIPGVLLDTTTYELNMAAGGFATNPQFVFIQGRLQDGAGASGAGDIYPGTTSVDMKHDYPKPLKTGWKIMCIGLKDL